MLRKFLSDKVHLSDEFESPNNVILPCSWLCTLISLFPDATSQQIQILGLKPILWEFENTRHSLRQ
jgi:hypothetical protein